MDADVQPHDDAEQRSIRLRVCAEAKKAIGVVAAVTEVTEAALFDAVLHGLATADPVWLDAVTARARTIDLQRRRQER